jgi:MFS family permease
MTIEGMLSMGFFSITTSGFLAAFALALGANNLQIGILAAIPFITQLIQLPTIVFIEHFRNRKPLTVITWFIAQGLWIPMALIPLFIDTPSAAAISALLFLLGVRGVFAAVTACGWNSWLRDLIPHDIIGHIYSKRLTMATIVAIVFSLCTAFFIDYWKASFPNENEILGYTIAFLFGAIFLGLTSPIVMSRIPEPQMQVETNTQSLWTTLTAPLKDVNFRRLIRFLFFWAFASNLAIPFFAVYMLRKLGMPLSSVIGLSVLSQLFNILFLRVWGTFVDRFSSKTILSLNVTLYILVILSWTFTTMPGTYYLTIPLLVILHIFAGIATAGITLTVATIGLKLAPRGYATSYLAGVSLATALGTGIGPIVGGLLADFFSVREFQINFIWKAPTQFLQLPALSFAGLDFLFALAFIIGLLTLNALANIREEGEVGKEVVLDELMAYTRSITRAVSSVPGLRFISMFPFGYIRNIPGIDIALSVTAYQLSDMVKTVTTAVLEGKKATNKLAKALEQSLSPVVRRPASSTRTNGFDLARHSARGVIHAIEETPSTLDELVEPAIEGTVQSLRQAHVSPRDAFRGAGYGIIQGTIETEADLVKATSQIYNGAGKAARKLKLSRNMAEQQAIEGALTAIYEIAPEELSRVETAIPPKLYNTTVQKITLQEKK